MTFLVIIIILALIFDYINGFHDAANSIATIVSTKVLTPFQAVLWAALFNFCGIFHFQIPDWRIQNWKYHCQFRQQGFYYAGSNFFRIDRCHSLESAYLVVWYSIEFFPYPDRRFYGAAIAHAGALRKTRSFRNQLCKSDSHVFFHIPGSDHRDGYWIYHYDFHHQYLSSRQSIPGG